MARADVRARILQASRIVFSRKGYKATTVGDILVEAGVARGTFYRYFSSKRHVFHELSSDLFRAVFEAAGSMLAGVDEPVMLRIGDSLAQCYRLFVDNRGFLLTYMREGIVADPGLYALWDDFDRKMTGLLVEVLKSGAARGELREVDNDPVSRAMLMIFLLVPYRDILMPARPELDVQGLASEMVRLILDGLLPRGSKVPA